MQTRHLTLIALLALAACVAPPPPAAPKPAPVSPPVVAAPAAVQRLTGDWNDWPFTPGEWTYRRDARGSIGLFGMVGQNPLVILRCDMQAGRLYLSREGSGTGRRMIVRTSSMMKEFAATPAAEIMPSDPILDAMAFSRGRVLIEIDGQQPTVLPSWAEITRVVEDCRR